MRSIASLVTCVALGFVVASADAGVKLKAVRFPTSIDGLGGSTVPPVEAPLSQRVVFEFTGKPKIGANVADVLRIRFVELTTGKASGGLPAVGTYQVVGKKVVFTPRLPTAGIPAGFGPGSDPTADLSLPGLLPASQYQITVNLFAADGVLNLDQVASGLTLPLDFTTVGASPVPGALPAYFANLPPQAPLLKKKKGILPKDGTKGLHPNAFLDPAGLFAGIPAKKRPPFRLDFRGPLEPSDQNLARIRLRAVKSQHGAPLDQPLTSTAVLVENAPERARVLVYPEGLLPLGHVVVVESSGALLSLAGVAAEPSATAGYDEVARYHVVPTPQGGAALDEALVEEFADAAHLDATVAADGFHPAAWNATGDGHLRATFGFGGDGSLGSFAPADNGIEIHLDTDYQVLPLFSGATPDAPPGTVVTGGVFHFTNFHLPPSVTLIARGSHPLVITCTGDARIEGRIDLNGGAGASDHQFDAALNPVPGGTAGPGGGRGGFGHPVELPAGAPLASMQTPSFGGSGLGPRNQGLGGGGGQSGATLPFAGFAGGSCAAFSHAGDGSRGAGGGGGSFQRFFPLAPEDPGTAVSGRRGGAGIGNHLPIPYDPALPLPAEPQVYEGLPGNPTNALARLNPNPTFAQAVGLGLIADAAAPFDVTTAWATSRRITLFGNAGPAVFADVDPTNDFIGPAGEVTQIHGGQGGGAGASRTEGLTYFCKTSFLDMIGLPPTLLDARGGGGGGGGGALLFQALGVIEFRGANAAIEARGGAGGGGELAGASNAGGAGGGGAGGAVILQSATNVLLDDPALPVRVIDVSGGCATNAAELLAGPTAGTPGSDAAVLQVGDGGPGGPGLVQIHVPAEAPWRVLPGKANARVYPSLLQIGTGTPGACGGEPTGTVDFDPLVDRAHTPTPLTPVSVARSTWYDLGSVTSEFRPPVPTGAGPLAGPVFGIPGVGPFFHGTDPTTGLVQTDAAGFLPNPAALDLAIDAPDLGLPNHLPNGPAWFQSVQIRFEGADDDPAQPGSPDLTTATGFVTDVTKLNGKRHVRFEVRFDIATDPNHPASVRTPRPLMHWLRLPFKY